MAHYFTIIGRHLEWAIQPELVVKLEFVLIERKHAVLSISPQFYHMPERHERVLERWHCAKVKGHAELIIQKPRVKTLSYDFPKLHHPKPNSLCANVHLRQSLWKTVKVTERSRRRHTKVKASKSEGALKVPMCLKFGAIPTIRPPPPYLQSYGILTKSFSNLPLPQVKNGRPKKFWVDSGLFYWVIVVTSQVAIFVPGQRSR